MSKSPTDVIRRRSPSVTASRDGVSDGSLQSLSGWGGQPRSTSAVMSPSSTADVIGLEPLMSGHIARGLGRSYGDAAQLGGGTVVDMTGMTGIRVDPVTGSATAEAGASLGQVIDVAWPHGWFLPVAPGTRHVTVGGAIASDVHGKNHHRDGSFGQHVESLELITTDGRILDVEPGTEAFAATVGGMGLTGIITKATFRLIRMETPWMSVDSGRAADFVSLMDRLSEADTRHRYSVAWVDLSRQGRGRGIVMGADHARSEETRGRPRESRSGSGTITVPGWSPPVVNDLTVSLFNGLWYSLAPRRETARIRSLNSFFFPLDSIANWNRLYGRKGFLQYQFVVPYGEESTLMDVAEKLAGSSTPVSLAVLKRMRTSTGGLLSFAMAGWTLAVDMPLGNRDLAQTLDKCDASIARVGGRVYLAKDSRLRADMFHEMYPGVPRWRESRDHLDRAGALRSNLSRRLGLTD